MSTLRAAEVAADPTNLLAIVAATRADADVRLGAVQRVLRAQPFGTDRASSTSRCSGW